jgi:hypothetical protein
VISNNKLTDKCVEQVAAVLSRNKFLSTLNMCDNQITNKVAKNKLINSLKKIDVIIWIISIFIVNEASAILEC